MKQLKIITRYFYFGLSFLLLSGLLATPDTVLGQNDEVTLKAAFMERFTRFIDWPEESLTKEADSSFVVLILGENPFGDALEVLFSTTEIKGRKVDVIYSDKITDIANCHMAYISSSLNRQLDDVVDEAKEYSVLTIGDTRGFCDRGILINFFADEDVLRFELNIKGFKESQLEVSHLLLNIAKVKE